MTGSEIRDIINDFIKSDKYKNMVDGENYYLGKNDILKRKFYMYGLVDKEYDTYRSNIKTASNFIKPIIDHKISYCFSNDIVLENFETMAIDYNEEIDVIAENAAKASIGWGYIYINNLKELKLINIDPKTIIPIYESSIEHNLIKVIRFYEIDTIKYAEVWENDYMILYECKKDEYIIIDSKINDWGIIPFIPFKNNNEQTTDIENIKALIDAYDIILSDFNNNFIDFQEAIILLKNYADNVATPEAAIEIMNWFKKYKIINVKADGGLEILTREIPYQARKELVSLLRKLIYETAQAVDLEELKGGSLTNIVIKAYFIFFDLKCNKIIKEAKKFIKKLMLFSNLYNQMRNTSQSNIVNAKIVFNKSILINETEIIENCVKSDGIISKKTVISNHPWVTDIDNELKQIDEDLLNDKSDITGGFNDDSGPIE